MHDLFQSQRASTNPAGDYGAGAAGQGGGAESDEAPAAGDLSAASRVDSGRMGYCAEPSPGRRRGRILESGARTVEALPAGAASGARARFPITMKIIALGIIRFYQACISPTLPSSCRFYPSCSAYAYEAVEKWGVWRGTRMALRRLLRCRPYAGHGYDPVP